MFAGAPPVPAPRLVPWRERLRRGKPRVCDCTVHNMVDDAASTGMWWTLPTGMVPRRERLTRDKRKELRELGFDPNDGYDYTRHLRQVGEGGGTFQAVTNKDHVAAGPIF